jgi:hypothetical protein
MRPGKLVWRWKWGNCGSEEREGKEREEMHRQFSCKRLRRADVTKIKCLWQVDTQSL